MFYDAPFLELLELDILFDWDFRLKIEATNKVAGSSSLVVLGLFC